MDKLDIKYIDEQTVSINGVRFAIEFFTCMAAFMVGQSFKVVSRENETISIEKIEPS
jgi:hypothetical protein